MIGGMIQTIRTDLERKTLVTKVMKGTVATVLVLAAVAAMLLPLLIIPLADVTTTPDPTPEPCMEHGWRITPLLSGTNDTIQRRTESGHRSMIWTLAANTTRIEARLEAFNGCDTDAGLRVYGESYILGYVRMSAGGAPTGDRGSFYTFTVPAESSLTLVLVAEIDTWWAEGNRTDPIGHFAWLFHHDTITPVGFLNLWRVTDGIPDQPTPDDPPVCDCLDNDEDDGDDDDERRGRDDDCNGEDDD